MSARRDPGKAAIQRHGFWIAHRWLLLRRAVQLGVLSVFLTGPWFGLWITRGTLASSMTLDVLPLTDPFILLQGLLAGHRPEMLALIGAAIVVVAYLILGGRLYCSWVCPINPVADLAQALRRRLDIGKGWAPQPRTRLFILGAALVASAATGTIAWELINPITSLHRSLLFGFGWGSLTVAGVFLLDTFLANHGWCGHLCPVGAFYGALNHTALLRVSARGRVRCDDCMDCYAVCPEMHVISPALKGERTGRGPLIQHADCTACGRCIDVCPERVFTFTHRFDQRLDPPAVVAADPMPPAQRDAAA